MTPKSRHPLAPPPSGGHALLRRLVSGFSAGILAAGVLAGTAASSLPGTPGTRAADGAALAASAAVAEPAGVTIGRVGGAVTSVPETLDQIFALLERAERAAHESGREITPAISQAAAELGMLLTTYLAQHDDVATEIGDGVDIATTTATAAAASLPEPVAPRATTDPEAADEAGAASDGATSDDGDVDAGAADADADAVDDADAGAAADADTDATDDADADAGAAADAAADASDVAPTADEQPEVTFDDLVLAAMRLATLLDSEGVYRVAVSGAAPLVSEDAPLTTMLREAVERYGSSTDGYANGRIPADVLCALPFAPGHRLRCDAAAQLVALNTAYEAKFGRPIPMTDSYRTLASQVVLKAQKPHLAATPGRSLHGWGIAVDLAAPISSGTSPEYLWLRLNGPDYGWDNPSWARLDGSKPEPWHFEFFAAGPMPDRALSAEDVALYRAASSRPTGSTTTQQPTTTPTTSDATPSATETPAPTPSSEPTPTTKPTPTPSTKPTDPAGEPTEDPSTDPSAGDQTPSTGPTGQPTTDPSTDDPTDPSTDEPADPSAEDPTDEPTDDPSAEPSDEPTDDPTDPGADPAGDPVTDPGAGQNENPADVGTQDAPPSDVVTAPEPATTPTRGDDDQGDPDDSDDPDTPGTDPAAQDNTP